MDPKKLALPDPRRRVVSGHVLWVGASLFILSLLLLSHSFKGRVMAPLLQGFNSVSTNSSIVSWPFSFPSSYFPSSVNINGNNDTSKELNGSSDFIAISPKAGVLDFEVLMENSHLGNSTENVKNGKFTVEEGKIQDQEENHDAKSGNFTDSRGIDNYLGNYSYGVKNETFHSENGIVGSLSANGYMDGSKTFEGKSAENSSTAISTNVNNNTNSNLLFKEELGRSPAREENQKNTSFVTCDIFDGQWVRDDSKPYYPAGSCPHIDRDFDCHLNGRPDDGFVKWTWQPNGCNIPSFNATDFLGRLRGQKLVFVGDSLNRNMWESLVCILRHSIRNKKRVYEISGRREFKKKGFYAFIFEDYNCTVDFVSSPFLVREASFSSKNGTIETLRLDMMDRTTSMYQDADILVFNTGHWWTHEKTSRGEDYYQEGNYVHPRLKVLEAYRRALLTWARWIEKNVDFNRTQVFFRGYSVTHFRGGRWNSGGQCHKETEPIFNPKHLMKYPSKMRTFDHVLREMKHPVISLNISRLTDYRKDGHPSIYRMQYKTEEERIAAERSQDCSHWCLPGVPDTWNELLYASLLKAGRGSWRI